MLDVHGLRKAIHTHNGGGDLRHWFISAWLSFLLSVFPGHGVGATKPAGDLAPLANPDGVLNAADALILQRFILGSLTPSPEQILIADVAPLGNPDGELNAGDLVVLMRAIQGQISLPPVYTGPAAPVLNAASGTTHNNPYTLSGTAEAGRDVRLYLNGALYETATASGADGSFAFQLILRDGENQLYAVVVDAGQEGPVSDLISLDYVNNISRQQGGTLTADAVWTPGVATTPYVVTSTLTVAAGTTLTLMPGTVLRFAAGTAFQIDGTVIVRGDATDPVVFTSDAANPVRGNWAGIQIRAGSLNNRIESAVVEYAVNGITADATNLIVQDCTVRLFASSYPSYGIGYTNGATGDIENCIIDNQGVVGSNGSVGVAVYSGAQPHLKDNQIINTGTGIIVEQSAPWISGNAIRNNGTGMLLFEGASALINGQNVISENTQSGLQFEGSSENYPQCVVSNNSIFNNQWNVLAISYDYQGDQDIFLGNNWWGSASPSVISNGVWDYADTPDLAPIVQIAPFLDGPAGVPVPGNFLNGRLTQNTVLTAGDRYTVVGAYVAEPTAMLTIAAGAQIDFASNALMVANGKISIEGEVDNRVLMKSVDDLAGLQPGWGLLIDGVNDSVIRGARFENLYIATQMYSGNADISDSEYSNNRREAIIFGGSSGRVADNLIDGIKRASTEGNSRGISVSGSSDVVIERNAITGIDIGLQLSSGNILAQENLITGTTYAVYLCCSSNLQPTITNGNTITNNDYGVYSYDVTNGVVAINGNNIHDNGYNYYKFRSTLAEDATNNWWGTAVESEVSTGIYAETAGTVNYLPFLQGPIPIAPRLDAAPALTVNSPLTVTGTAQVGTQVRVYVNTVLQATVGVSASGVFTALIPLTEGQNTIYAEAFTQTTVSAPSGSIDITLDTTPPVITLASPQSNSRINLNPTFQGTLSEVASITIAGQAVTILSDNSFNQGPIVLNEGSNTISLVATDLAGHATTLNISITLDTTPPADPDMGRVSFGTLAGGVISVTGSPGAVEAGSQVYVTNARTGSVVMVSAEADGAFSNAVAAQLGDMITLVVTDDLGNQTAWNHEMLSGAPAPLSIGATNPADGATVVGSSVTIAGEFQGPLGTGISVAGQVAELHGNQFVANHVPLTTGTNSIDITATAPDGEIDTQTLTLTSTGSIPFSINVSPESGGLPYTGVLTLTNGTGLPMQLVELDIEGDGTYESVFSNLNYAVATWNISYASPGLYLGRVRVVDAAGTGRILTFGVMVEDVIGKQARVRSVYQQMLNRLGQNDTAGALRLFEKTAKSNYAEVFSSLGADLPMLSAQLRNIQGGLLGNGIAEFSVAVEQNGAAGTYFIYLQRGGDGVWRIYDM